MHVVKNLLVAVLERYHKRIGAVCVGKQMNCE